MHLKLSRVLHMAVNITGSTYLKDFMVACFQFDLGWAPGLLQSAVNWGLGRNLNELGTEL